METLKKLVIKEAKNLKKHAFKTELKRLDFKDLVPESYSWCIYGQMTGFCTSNRAQRLIRKCCTKVVENTFDERVVFASAAKMEPRCLGGVTHFSPIEKFIMDEQNRTNGNNFAIISYLKGETKTLKLV